MTSKNDESAAMATAVGFIVAGAVALAMMVFAVLAFIAFVLTILSIVAWNSPLRLGKWTIEPEEARSFVRRGLVGAWLVPVFALFCEFFLNVQINWDYLAYLILGGYVAGSIGLEIMFAKENQQVTMNTNPPPVERMPAPPQRYLAPPPQEQFRFATWDDEDQ